jgi:hypothetical protein
MALVLRPDPGTLGDQKVMHGEWQVGQIDKRPSFVNKDSRFIWALNGVPSGPKGLRLAGVAESIETAEAELKKSWEEWLAWASLSDMRQRS